MRSILWVLLAVGAFGQSYDIVLAGGKIVDGTGNGWYYADVGIRGDRIARITPAGGTFTACRTRWRTRRWTYI